MVPLAVFDEAFALGAGQAVDVAFHSEAEIHLVARRPRATGRHVGVAEVNARVPTLVGQRFPLEIENEISVLSLAPKTTLGTKAIPVKTAELLIKPRLDNFINIYPFKEISGFYFNFIGSFGEFITDRSLAS